MIRLKPFWILFVPLLVLLAGCFKEDEMVEPYPRGDAKTDTIAMTQTYKYQIYYNLDSIGTVSTNPKKESDLAFECKEGGWHIILNTANFMYAADLGVMPFGMPQDTVGVTWWFDRSDGNPDSTAIGVWFDINSNGDTISNHHVYAINRGLDDLGNPLGYMQVIFDSLKNGNFFFRFTPLLGGTPVSAMVAKDPSVNYRYFSFDDGGVIRNLQPPKPNWDLLFTQYTTLLFTDIGEAYPYLVTGVLINRNGVEVSKDTLNDFSTLTFDQAQQMVYSSNLDAIGYDWKYYNFEAGSYSVTLGVTYVIRNHNGFYYKLRFVGFYNELGQKGYPVIEYQQL
ncbi:MAG: HmuY family protein [Bacteroidales bacterium]|nr:HmuY family protein [Bacteroidales bacterium]